MFATKMNRFFFQQEMYIKLSRNELWNVKRNAYTSYTPCECTTITILKRHHKQPIIKLFLFSRKYLSAGGKVRGVIDSGILKRTILTMFSSNKLRNSRDPRSQSDIKQDRTDHWVPKRTIII